MFHEEDGKSTHGYCVLPQPIYHSHGRPSRKWAPNNLFVYVADVHAVASLSILFDLERRSYVLSVAPYHIIIIQLSYYLLAYFYIIIDITFR